MPILPRNEDGKDRLAAYRPWMAVPKKKQPGLGVGCLINKMEIATWTRGETEKNDKFPTSLRKIIFQWVSKILMSWWEAVQSQVHKRLPRLHVGARGSRSDKVCRSYYTGFTVKGNLKIHATPTLQVPRNHSRTMNTALNLAPAYYLVFFIAYNEMRVAEIRSGTRI